MDAFLLGHGVDFDFDIWTNVQVIECELLPPPNTHIP